MNLFTETSTFHHTQTLKRQMCDLIENMRFDVGLIPEPRARSMFETSAEVLAGLVRAFDDYEAHAGAEGSEAAGPDPAACPDSEL